MKQKLTIFILFLLFPFTLQAQRGVADTVDLLFRSALTSRVAYENLRFLCKHTAGRICGSPQAAAAVEYTRQLMLDLKLDTVYLQDVMVPRWIRGEEFTSVQSSRLGYRELHTCALGMSPGTPEEGITGKVIEVKSLDELRRLDPDRVRGRVVFFNRPMDPVTTNTFAAYGQAVDQRTSGPALAASLGASAAIVRSPTTAMDQVPHTGVTDFPDNKEKIPAMAISTLDADLLSAWLRQDPDLFLHLASRCRIAGEVLSHNVIGEIRGRLYPEQIITVGGHLDAWDTGEGAHDDGAGCIQSIEVLRLFRETGIRPKRTVRAVMFMDEEISQSGAKVYLEAARVRDENHYAALEADRGALSPRGFGMGNIPDRLDGLLALRTYFLPYGITEFTAGGGGADIGPLGAFHIPLMGYIPDAQRYFDYHHSANDRFEAVQPRELQLGSAAMAAIIYLVDRLDR